MFNKKRTIINKKDFIQILATDNHITKSDSIKAYDIIFNTINKILLNFDIGDKLVLPKAMVIEARKARTVGLNIPNKKVRYFIKLYLNKTRS